LEHLSDIVKEVEALLRMALDKFNEMDDGDTYCEVYVCLDCRKVVTDFKEICDCWDKKHTELSIIKWECDDVLPVLIFIEWLQKQAEGGISDAAKC